MSDALQSALGPGAALAGVLLIAGVAAGSVGGRVPHLGMGALAPAAAVAATRGASFGRTGAVLIAVLIGAVAGAAGWALDRRARRLHDASVPLIADAGVAGLGLAVSVLFRPAVFVELPLGPLGGVATPGYALAAAMAALAGAAVVTVLVHREVGDLWVWVLATAAGAVAVLLGSGALSLLAAAATPVFTIADTVGLGLRAAAVGFAARWGPAWALAAAMVLGFGEALVRALPASDLALLPMVVLLAAGAVVLRRQRAAPVEPT